MAVRGNRPRRHVQGGDQQRLRQVAPLGGGLLEAARRAAGRSRSTGSGRDDGSAIAEFVLVAALVLLLGVGVFQLGLLLHVRNTLLACAAEGARAGARADATPADGVSRTTWLVTESLSAQYATQVNARTARTPGGVDVVEVTVTAPTPVIGLLGPAGTVTVTGRAFAEAQVTAP